MTSREIVESNREKLLAWEREGGAYKEEHTKLDITIELIGTAKADMPLGVVVASFNAG